MSTLREVDRLSTLSAQDYTDLEAVNDTGHHVALTDGIVARAYSAEVRLPLLKYEPLLLEAFAQAAPTLAKVAAAGYRPWLFLANTPFTTEKAKLYPEFSLSRPALEAGLLREERLEMVTHENDRHRTFGLYAISEQKLADACEFLTKNAKAMIVLSKRKDFLTSATLKEVEETAGRFEDGRPASDMNWIRAAVTFAPRGDILLLTRGRFDDLDRAIMFVFNPASQVDGIFDNRPQISEPN